MRPEDVDAALVEKFANALGLAYVAEQMPEYARNLRLGLAAVLPEIQAQALESLRDEFKTWHVYETRDMGDAFSSDLVIEEVEDRIAELHAARLTTTTEGSDV